MNKDLSTYFDTANISCSIVDVGKTYEIYGDIVEYRISYYNPYYFKWSFIEWRQ
ncbi:hypothetical protein [Spiroplasma sp. SV19]|uniref:hypothetical protein n=1 Tax=Spiroplasma sp. SV19 TaxID=2570468 RepID=UPI0024B7396E|nr:hypothetical protein [Spiroplasma sp. SV19]